ncbi:DUF868 family protein [Senna tora]|uniref:DUF868 family protein n=1 Tax=Senna tora TaxID=362788 RepID=A0A834TUS2_9FABA|nr:DUF868 family protein [Senna tora]
MMAFNGHRSCRAQSVSSSSLHQATSNLVKKTTEEPQPTGKAAQSTVTCIYQTNIGGSWRNVSFMWSKNLMNHTLLLTVDSIGGDLHYNCKIDVKPWNFWNKKGYKSFDVDEGNQVEVYWDLRSAKFSNSPEPISDYYIALVSDEQIALLIGDYKKKAYKRTKSRPAHVDAIQLIKKENVFAKKTFSTKAKFDEKGKESEVVVECSGTTSGSNKDPEMWVSIDGIVLIHVKNLQWKFRGNQTVMVDKQPIQVLWDVHDWLFSGSGSGPGLFVFKPGPADQSESEKEGSTQGGCESDDGKSVYYSTSNNFDFCLALMMVLHL